MDLNLNINIPTNSKAHNALKWKICQYYGIPTQDLEQFHFEGFIKGLLEAELKLLIHAYKDAVGSGEIYEG
jgi:hypothetical protein